MMLFKRAIPLQKYLLESKKKGQTVGFVPTMGALHQGHLSLIQQSKSQNDITVCSIFVNPTQFNDEGDLKRYPRTIEQDLYLLSQQGTDIVFLPTVEEVYPPDIDTAVDLDLGSLDKFMEGEHRPGHFSGVVQVVKRLLDIVIPNHIYMGQKDYQQFCIIRYMVQQLALPTKVVRCDIIREANGLAMSSRNMLLAAAEKEIAATISKTLGTAKQSASKLPLSTVKQQAMEQLSTPPFQLDYFEIADQTTLQPATNFNQPTVACTAVFLGKVRLIDNILIDAVV